MIFLLSFLLSWLSGMLAILIFSFIAYEHFNIMDITSFAVFTLAGCLILIPVIYLLVLKFPGKRTTAGRQFIYFPAVLILLANVPAYFIIWKKTGDLYGKSEALLFSLCFIVTALVFGMCMAWKNNMLKKV